MAVHGMLAMVPSALDVQVLDITVEGVLLRANQAMDIGARGRLRLNLSDAAFDADIEVRRVSPAAHDGTTQWYDIGAAFLTMSPEDRQLIERFANQ